MQKVNFKPIWYDWIQRAIIYGVIWRQKLNDNKIKTKQEIDDTEPDFRAKL